MTGTSYEFIWTYSLELTVQIHLWPVTPDSVVESENPSNSSLYEKVFLGSDLKLAQLWAEDKKSIQ